MKIWMPGVLTGVSLPLGPERTVLGNIGVYTNPPTHASEHTHVYFYISLSLYIKNDEFILTASSVVQHHKVHSNLYSFLTVTFF